VQKQLKEADNRHAHKEVENVGRIEEKVD